MTRLRMLLPVLLGLQLLPAPLCAQPNGAALEKLRATLLSGVSATQVLTQYCAELKLAAPPAIRAVRDGTALPAPADVRAALKAEADETIRYRRVRLTCGDHV